VSFGSPEAFDLVAVEDRVGRDDPCLLADRLGGEKPIEGIAVDARQRTHGPRVAIGYRQTLERELVQTIWQVVGSVQLADRALDGGLPDTDRTEKDGLARILDCGPRVRDSLVARQKPEQRMGVEQ
jgi:hypothetical protein